MDTIQLLETIKEEMDSTYYSQGCGFDDYSDGYTTDKSEDMAIIDAYIRKMLDEKGKSNDSSN